MDSLVIVPQPQHAPRAGAGSIPPSSARGQVTWISVGALETLGHNTGREAGAESVFWVSFVPIRLIPFPPLSPAVGREGDRQ